jgi:hypothetical protein
MSSRQLEEARDRQLDEHVAEQLGISIEALAGYPYELDEAGYGIVWRLAWPDGPPPGVETSGPKGSEWTDIHPLHQPDEPST